MSAVRVIGTRQPPALSTRVKVAFAGGRSRSRGSFDQVEVDGSVPLLQAISAILISNMEVALHVSGIVTRGTRKHLRCRSCSTWNTPGRKRFEAG